MRQRDFSSRRMLCAMLAAVVGLAAGGARADVVVEGAVSPLDPTTWTASTNVLIGCPGVGSVMVNGGSGVVANGCGLGESSGAPGSLGTLTVDGVGSSWQGTSLGVGSYGAGAVVVTGGGLVSASRAIYLGAQNGSGSLTVDGSGSVCTVGTDFRLGFVQGATGTMVIKNGGAVNVGGFFEMGSSAGTAGNTIIDGGMLNATVSFFYVGNSGNGGLTIVNGGVCNVGADCAIADSNNAVGRVTVDGAGSKWDCRNVTLGTSGSGSLIVTNGGTVNLTGLTVSFQTGGASGVVIVDGPGSSLIDANGLTLGHNNSATMQVSHGGSFVCTNGAGSLRSASGYTKKSMLIVDGGSAAWSNGSLTIDTGAALMIANGGRVSAKGITTVYNSNLFSVLNVGDLSALDAGTGIFTNKGKMRLRAVPDAAMGSYQPIGAATWSPGGAWLWQALGGTWDTSSHVFTMSAAATGVPGVGVTIDRSVQQRVVITDATTLDCVQAGFQATAGSSNLTLTGTELTDGQKAGLVGLLPAGQGVLDGWALSVIGWSPIYGSEQVSLSFKVGGGQATENLSVWRYSGSTWAKFGPDDLTYDGTYASFTDAVYDRYAVVGQVPEPTSLAVVAIGAMGVLRRRRRGKLKVKG